jgi:hypothetical protein
MERGGGARNHYVMGVGLAAEALPKSARTLQATISGIVVLDWTLGVDGISTISGVCIDNGSLTTRLGSLIAMECFFLWESDCAGNSAPQDANQSVAAFHFDGFAEVRVRRSQK